MAIVRNVHIVQSKYGTYYLHYTTPAGRRRRISAGTDYQLVQRQAVKFNDWLMDAKDPEVELERARQSQISQRLTLREFFPVFIQRHGSLQSKAMQASYNHSFKSICRCPAIADSPLTLLTKRHVLEYMRLRVNQDGVKNATANKEANFIKGVLSRAVEWGMLERNPILGLKLLPESEKRRVELTPTQAAQLIALLPPSIDAIAEFAIYSGFRRENILSLKIESINLHALTDSADVELLIKGGRRERFPLGRHSVRVLRQVIGQRKSGHVFLNPGTGRRYTTISKTFDRAVRKLDLTVNGTKLRFHDLRHVFCTWLLREGVNIEAIRELAGHRSRQTTDRYVSLNRMEVGKYLSVLPDIRNLDNQSVEAV